MSQEDLTSIAGQLKLEKYPKGKGSQKGKGKDGKGSKSKGKGGRWQKK